MKLERIKVVYKIVSKLEETEVTNPLYLIARRNSKRYILQALTGYTTTTSSTLALFRK
jgi:hypothetical protein